MRLKKRCGSMLVNRCGGSRKVTKRRACIYTLVTERDEQKVWRGVRKRESWLRETGMHRCVYAIGSTEAHSGASGHVSTR